MKLRRTRLSVWPVVLLLFVVGVTGWHIATAAPIAPAAGRLLVATRLQQGFFARSVILLIAYGPDGAVGVVINHPTRLALAAVLPNMGVLRSGADPLYLGGPVSLDSLTILIRSQTAPPESLEVLDGVYASGSMEALRAVVRHELAGASFRTYAGYAGWAPGQLDSELEQGAWTVVPAEAGEIFSSAPEKLWDRLSKPGDLLLVRDVGYWIWHDDRIRLPSTRPSTFPLSVAE
jgi:putative transcriptional regulator